MTARYLDDEVPQSPGVVGQACHYLGPSGLNFGVEGVYSADADVARRGLVGGRSCRPDYGQANCVAVQQYQAHLLFVDVNLEPKHVTQARGPQGLARQLRDWGAHLRVRS